MRIKSNACKALVPSFLSVSSSFTLQCSEMNWLCSSGLDPSSHHGLAVLDSHQLAKPLPRIRNCPALGMRFDCKYKTLYKLRTHPNQSHLLFNLGLVMPVNGLKTILRDTYALYHSIEGHPLHLSSHSNQDPRYPTTSIRAHHEAST